MQYFPLFSFLFSHTQFKFLQNKPNTLTNTIYNMNIERFLLLLSLRFNFTQISKRFRFTHLLSRVRQLLQHGANLTNHNYICPGDWDKSFGARRKIKNITRKSGKNKLWCKTKLKTQQRSHETEKAIKSELHN